MFMFSLEHGSVATSLSLFSEHGSVSLPSFKFSLEHGSVATLFTVL